MPVRRAKAEWKGDLREGTGTVATQNGAVSGQYSFGSRFEAGEGTNPEELIGAALAGCFSMALAGGLARAGHPPQSIQTEASVHLDKSDHGFSVTRIVLETAARVEGIEAGAFREQVEAARTGCPMARVMTGTEIQVDARLV